MSNLIRTLRSRAAVAASGAALLGAALLAGCGGGSSTDPGTLRVSMTDAPSCGFDEVNVTVQKVRIHKSASAGANDAGWTDITLATPKKLNLLDLQNGALEELGQTPLEPGKYQQMRLVLVDNGTTPLAESVVPTGGSETALETPSGLQSGLKMNVDIDIASNKMADVVIDFDACKSVVTAGQAGKYQLKPVLAVTPVFISGVTGYADAGDAVSLQTGDGTVVKSTVADSTGKFLLKADAGTYNLVVTAPAHATDVIIGVPVVTETVTTVSTSGSPLVLAASTTGPQAGAVAYNPVSTPIDATVAALQTLSGGAKITVASMAVDSVTGAYSFTLPLAAPLVAPYVAPPAALAFAADASAAAKYTMAATSGGVTKTSSLLTLTTGPNAAVNFTFP